MFVVFVLNWCMYFWSLVYIIFGDFERIFGRVGVEGGVGKGCGFGVGVLVKFDFIGILGFFGLFIIEYCCYLIGYGFIFFLNFEFWLWELGWGFLVFVFLVFLNFVCILEIDGIGDIVLDMMMLIVFLFFLIFRWILGNEGKDERVVGVLKLIVVLRFLYFVWILEIEEIGVIGVG